MMRKMKSVWPLAGALIFILVYSPSWAEKVYKWIDEKGTIHFSENKSDIPEKYREQAEKRFLQEEAGQTEEKTKPKKQPGKGKRDRVAVKGKGEIDRNKIEGDVMDSVKAIISFWKDEKYDSLYEHGDQKSRRAISKEDFKRRMKKKGIRLASSWETVRDIQVDVKSATLAFATAKVGFKPTQGGETKFRTEIYRMSLEKGEWKINLTKLLAVKI